MKNLLLFLKNDKFMKIIWLLLVSFTLAAVLNQCVKESQPISQGESVSQGRGTFNIYPGFNAKRMGYGGLVYIDHGLYYDSSTMIVYWWNGHFGMSEYATAPTAYYAPNGMPYRYNPSTNTFEEIKG